MVMDGGRGQVGLFCREQKVQQIVDWRKQT
jgi:hypothetical protein